VNPTDELATVALRSAEAEADEIEEGFESIARCGAKGDGAAQGDFAGVRRECGEELGLPIFCDADGEVPRVGCAAWAAEQAGGDELVAAKLAGGLVHGLVEGVAIDGGGGGIHPEAGRVGEA
jgi:hypothetical protein